MKSLFFLLAVLVLWAGVPLTAQERASYFDLPGQVLLPEGYNPSQVYPLVIWLPYTTGRAEDFFVRQGLGMASLPLVHFLPQGRPVTSDYLPDFMSYIGWFETRLLKDLETLRRKVKIDPDRIVLAGFSLGGDLTWAFLNRHPGLFRGGIMAGTRTSYPTASAVQKQLKERGVRAAFVIGSREDPARYQGIRKAWTTWEQAGIETRYQEIPGGGHVSGPAEAFLLHVLWALRWPDLQPELADSLTWDQVTEKLIRVDQL